MTDYKVPTLEYFEWQQPVEDKDLNNPPGGESKGDRYIVATGGGAWAGHDAEIATYNGTGWDFTSLREGQATWVKDENLLYVYTGAAWVLVLTNIVEDTSPEAGGQFDFGAHSAGFTEQVLTSGAAIPWDLALSNKAILEAGHNFTITVSPPAKALNAQLIITQDGTGNRVMDEIVTQSDATIAPGDVNAGTDEIVVTVDIPTGARIRFKTTVADLPDPLVEDTIYYAIRVDSTTIQVATTKANAHAGTQIDITDQGTGTHTVQQLVKWPDGTLGVLGTAVGDEDILSLTYKTADEQWYAQLGSDIFS